MRRADVERILNFICVRRSSQLHLALKLQKKWPPGLMIRPLNDEFWLFVAHGCLKIFMIQMSQAKKKLEMIYFCFLESDEGFDVSSPHDVH